MRLSVHRSLLVALGCAAAAGSYARHASAQTAGAESAVTPPRLLNQAPVELPAGESPAEPVGVELELTIDASGHVTAANVAKSGGAAFDEKALEAARSFAFEPARRPSRRRTPRRAPYA